MFYKGKDNRSADSITDKASLLEALADKNWVFTKEELVGILHNEFFDDATPLDLMVVDAVLMRIMLIDGVEVTEASLQANREQMIRQVFGEILGTGDTPKH